MKQNNTTEIYIYIYHIIMMNAMQALDKSAEAQSWDFRKGWNFINLQLWRFCCITIIISSYIGKEIQKQEVSKVEYKLLNNQMSI